jgi:uncharacterized protein YkwD
MTVMTSRACSPRPRRWALASASVLAVLSIGVLAPVTHAQPAGAASREVVAAPASDPGIESQFVSRINSLRASKGLNQLQVSGELVGVARAWTDRMVSAGQISHNPNLGSQVSGAWTKLGENVGVGHNVDGLMQAFINSPSHYANLVDPAWTFVGVGVSHAPDGRIYTTHNFMALGSAAPPPSPPPPSNPDPPSGTGSTAPPATTTTTAPPPPPPPPEPHPTLGRVTAVLEPLRSLEEA